MQYMILISKAPGSGYQAYAGWDQIYSSRREAEAAKRRALTAGHHGVQVHRIPDARKGRR